MLSLICEHFNIFENSPRMLKYCTTETGKTESDIVILHAIKTIDCC